MHYKECETFCEIKRKDSPLISTVPVDEYTKMVANNFDYNFTGNSEFYPFEFPKDLKDIEFNIMAIVESSGRGKNTLLKEFKFLSKVHKEYDL